MSHARFCRLSIALAIQCVCTYASATPKETHRYPFDPACAWGRLADGRGLILRCLTREESERLAKSAAPANVAQASAGPAPTVVQPTVTGPGTGTSAPAAASTTPPAAAAPANISPPGDVTVQAAAAAVTPSAESYSAELVAVTADEGELPLAKRKLAVPLDKYAKCVADHGGLTAATGQVEVEFLVRERGRAEGANSGKFQGMSEAAANCIAQVVDRRPTGAPEAPVVSATVVIRVRKKPAKK